MVRVGRLELPASSSQSWRATNCATPGCRQKKLAAFRFRGFGKSRENCTSAPSFFLSRSNPLRWALIGLPAAKKKLAAFRFRGFGKSRENCTSAPSFFSRSYMLCQTLIGFYFLKPARFRLAAVTDPGPCLSGGPPSVRLRSLHLCFSRPRRRKAAGPTAQHPVIVGRTSLRSVSAASVRAAKTAHLLRSVSALLRRT